MPGDHGFRFDDNQDVAPCRPKGGRAESRIFAPGFGEGEAVFARVKPGENLKGEVVARTEESVEDEKWNHRAGFIT
jgi:hypothetical protein